eukprot:CAMPEP_0115715332 /NCGR_PEP_ID=MMETSP0272-20121206/75728_1 /TAXON_ID=71861 /ORGANISM="Scrippsiella trochoidea, Strain CCMP3099" /LENGTH=111 /DNA_ID=CAMNT_0003157561 /DNA_START=306 /DNA_END=641 /DNA_ORIENTATION=+
MASCKAMALGNLKQLWGCCSVHYPRAAVHKVFPLAARDAPTPNAAQEAGRPRRVEARELRRDNWEVHVSVVLGQGDPIALLLMQRVVQLLQMRQDHSAGQVAWVAHFGSTK